MSTLTLSYTHSQIIKYKCLIHAYVHTILIGRSYFLVGVVPRF